MGESLGNRSQCEADLTRFTPMRVTTWPVLVTRWLPATWSGGRGVGVDAPDTSAGSGSVRTTWASSSRARRASTNTRLRSTDSNRAVTDSTRRLCRGALRLSIGLLDHATAQYLRTAVAPHTCKRS